jgi:prophage regulatory protein
MAHWRGFLDADARGGRYLPWKEVARATGLSRTTAWRLQKRDDFPAPYSISPGRVGYRQDEVEAWQASRALSPGRGPLSRGGDPGAAAPRPAAIDASGHAQRYPEGPPAARPEAPLAQEVSATDRPGAVRKPARRRRSEHAKAIAQQMLFDF